MRGTEESELPWALHAHLPAIAVCVCACAHVLCAHKKNGEWDGSMHVHTRQGNACAHSPRQCMCTLTKAMHVHTHQGNACAHSPKQKRTRPGPAVCPVRHLLSPSSIDLSFQCPYSFALVVPQHIPLALQVPVAKAQNSLHRGRAYHFYSRPLFLMSLLTCTCITCCPPSKPFGLAGARG